MRSFIVTTENVGIKDSLFYEEILVQILDLKFANYEQRKLHQSKSIGEISLLKKKLGKLKRI